MLLLSEITYENREANKWHLRLKLTLLIPAGRGVFIAQALWARSRGHGAAGLGFGGWRGGAAKLWDRGTQPTSGGSPQSHPRCHLSKGNPSKTRLWPLVLLTVPWMEPSGQSQFIQAAQKQISQGITAHFVICYFFQCPITTNPSFICKLSLICIAL